MGDRASQDQRLVEAVLRGDRARFARVVERFESLVAGVAWRYGVRAEDVEDVVSEVFVKVYQNLHRYRPVHPFSTWLYRLAVNHVLDRARRARKERGRTEMPAALADPSPGAADGLEARERARLVREAMGELAPHYREVVFLVYVEGRRVDETAELLRLPAGTVKSRLMRAREALRGVLVRRYPEHFGDSDALQVRET